MSLPARLTALFSAPDWLEQSRAQVLGMPIYLGADLAVPSAGTFTLRDRGGTKLVDAASVTITSGVAEYSMSSSVVTTTQAIGEPLVEAWRLTINGEDRTFERAAYVCRVRPYSTVTDYDLLTRHQDLAEVLLGPGRSTFERERAAVFNAMLLKLMGRQRWPFLIFSPEGLHEYQICKALEMIFFDAATQFPEAGFLAMSKDYREQAKEAWGSVDFAYDENQDGNLQPAEVATRVQAPVIIGQSLEATDYPSSGGRW